MWSPWGVQERGIFLVPHRLPSKGIAVRRGVHMTTQPSTEERLAHLEGAYAHLATKADVADLRGELKAEIVKAQLSMVRWMVGLGIAHAGIVVGVIVAVAG